MSDYKLTKDEICRIIDLHLSERLFDDYGVEKFEAWLEERDRKVAERVWDEASENLLRRINRYFLEWEGAQWDEYVQGTSRAQKLSYNPYRHGEEQ